MIEALLITIILLQLIVIYNQKRKVKINLSGSNMIGVLNRAKNDRKQFGDDSQEAGI